MEETFRAYQITTYLHTPQPLLPHAEMTSCDQWIMRGNMEY